MEGNISKENKAIDDVVLSITGNGVTPDMDNRGGNSINESLFRKGFGFGIKSQDNLKLQEQGNLTMSSPMSPEITPRISPFSTPQRPPKTPKELIRRHASQSRSALSKSKSRLIEPPSPSDDALDDECVQFVGSKTPLRSTPKMSPRVGLPVIPKSPFSVLGNNVDVDVDDDEDVYISVPLRGKEQCRKNVFVILEWILFVGVISLLVASLTIPQLRGTSFWSLGLWKWCVLVVVIFCGRLVTGWFIAILVYLAEQKLLFKKKVLYFVYGLKNSVQVFLWLSFVLVAWMLLVIHGNNRSRKIQKDLHCVTMTIAGCLVGAVIWLAKTILIKTLALSFHVKRFFDRMQESIFHQYVLQKLSGPPIKDMAEFARTKSDGQLSVERVTKGKGVEEVINVEKLHKINPKKVSAWTMKGLIDIIRRTKLSTISNAFGYDEEDDMVEQNEDITSEWEAKVAAIKIFNNVAKPGYKYIEEEDLLRFFKMDEVNQVFSLFEGASETGNIKKSTLKKWVVNAYLERKSLALSLNDTKTAVDDLNKIVSTVVLIIIVVVWNLMMGFLNTKLLVFITSQLLLAVFMFGNTVKTVFEAIIFVFVMHPFDVGDRCVIDGVQMVVEEMNILTTIFLRYDNEKISYPNSVLATKPISNFYRSPEMSDSVEFAIDFSTTVDIIAALKTKIKLYIESKPENWRPSHSVHLIDIVDMNSIKMALYVTHTINFQNTAEKGSRKSDLVMELKKIFEELGIKYHLLPLEVHVMSLGAPSSASVARL